MSRRQKPKVVQPDVLRVQDELEDAFTMEKLDKLPDAGLDAPEPSASLLERVAPEKRDEVLKVLRSQNARIRAYMAGESDGSDW